jgi:non-heme Fe2+,alpha-ketoglutarate-dependent halogenase
LKQSLSIPQIALYHQNGYLIDLPPVYSVSEMKEHNRHLKELMKYLKPGETAKDIREWHESSLWLYGIVMNPKILDLVECIVGNNFYVWGSNFFIKEPRTTDIVGWHQDAYYWPMAPHNSVTVWLAFSDVSPENGAMQIVPESHQSGVIKLRRSSETDSVLTLELESGTFREDVAVSLCLKAGQISLHDDRAVHGSPANLSDRQRAGLTIRYSGTEVKNDLKINPHFKTYLCRGVDHYRHNPVGQIPTNLYGRPNFKAVSKEEAGIG